MRLGLLVLLLLGAACSSKKTARNYKNCLKLRVGMARADMLKLMGPPDETTPYVEGKSLPHLQGRTAYEWANPASMPAPNHVSLSEDSGKIESIRCSQSNVIAGVFIEPPAKSTAAAVVAPADPVEEVDLTPKKLR